MPVYRKIIAALLLTAAVAGCAPHLEGRYPTGERGRSSQSHSESLGGQIERYFKENDVLERFLVDDLLIPSIIGK